jgi:hypothetical protein
VAELNLDLPLGLHRAQCSTLRSHVPRRRFVVPQLNEVVREIARASGPIDVVLPIASGLKSAAGRLHGLARAVPHVDRYLLEPVPDDYEWASPETIAEEIAEAEAAARELSVTLEDETRVDTELQAVIAGIKPAMRLSTEGTDEATLFRRYEGFGLKACAADGTFIDEQGEHGRSLRLVYVARTLEVAEHVRDVEQRTFAAGRGPPEYRDLGLALGYPACCVDAYVGRVIASKTRLPEAYVVAAAAQHASPHWSLNHLLFESGSAVITFTPCSYRCQAALAYAARVLQHVPAERLHRRLAVTVAVDRQTGSRFILREGRAVVPRTPRGAFVHQHALGDDPVVVAFGV